MQRHHEPNGLSWVIHGVFEQVECQVLPASETGISPGVCEIRAGLRVADIKSFITSKCIAAGQQDMHDVAAICIMYPEHGDYCRNAASTHGCLDKLESWLSDGRLQQRYQPKTG